MVDRPFLLDRSSVTLSTSSRNEDKSKQIKEESLERPPSTSTQVNKKEHLLCFG